MSSIGYVDCRAWIWNLDKPKEDSILFKYMYLFFYDM